MVFSGGVSRATGGRAVDALSRWTLPALAAALMLWAYAGLWTAGPVYEDHNSSEAHEDAILEPSSPSVNDSAWFRRPVTTLSYRLTNNFGGGARAAHVTSFLLHVAVVGAVAGLALAVGAQPLVAGAIVALHPLASESVIYLSARSELLATLCIVLALWAMARGHMLAGAVAAVLSGLANPATCAALLVLLPLCLWRGWIPSFWRDETLLLLAILSACVTLGLVSVWSTAELSESAPWTIYAARQVSGIVSLAGMLLWPWPLLIDHGFAWVGWDAIVPRLILLSTATGAALALGRRAPWVPMALAWWIAGFGARLWIPSWNYVTEHHAYLPLVGVALCTADWVQDRCV